MVEDAADRELVRDEGDDGHLAAATGAGEWIDLVDLADQPRPGGRAAPAGLAGLFDVLSIAQRRAPRERLA
ncbi:MAG: hypothetical protein ACREKA_03975 [Candidatus Methylomirabilales bacterium]